MMCLYILMVGYELVKVTRTLYYYNQLVIRS